jgi:hypothetical protein
MKLFRDVNKSLFLMPVILFLLGTKISFAQEKKSDLYMFIYPIKLTTELEKEKQAIQQVMIQTVLMTRKFEIVLSQETKLEDLKIRLYELKSSVAPTSKAGFFHVTMELVNPKIAKTVRSVNVEMVSSKRMLFAIRLMVLQIVFGEKYKEKMQNIEEFKDLDATPVNTAPGVPEVKPVAPLPVSNSVKNETSSLDGKKKSDSPSSDEVEPSNFAYKLGSYIQKQTVESSGQLKDLTSEMMNLNLELGIHWKYSKTDQNRIVFNGHYGQIISKNFEESPPNWSLSTLYNKKMSNSYGFLGGLGLERSSFANYYAIASDIEVGTLKTLWAQLGIDSNVYYFKRKFYLSFNFFKSLLSQISFTGVSNSQVSSSGYEFFVGSRVFKNFHAGLRYSSYSTQIISSYKFSNSDDRISLGVYYPIGF